MKIQKAFVKPNNRAHIYKDRAINDDIRDYMQMIFPKCVGQCTDVAKIFKGKNELETAKFIWTFLRRYCKYRRDPESNQIIREPAYFVNAGNHTGDCKTFATFARSVYAKIYPHLETAFKFTGYRSIFQKPSHVYTVVKDSKGNEIIIDGCYNYFNKEKPYILALPLKFKTMKVSSLSGIDNTPNRASEIAGHINATATAEQRERIKRIAKCRRDLQFYKTKYDAGEIGRDRLRHEVDMIKLDLKTIPRPLAPVNGINGKKKKKKLTKEEKAARRKRIRERAKKFGKKLLHGIAFVNLLPIRAAFNTIVACNFNAIAHNLRYVYNERNGKTKEEWKKIEKVWERVGGLKKALLKAIQLGAKHKPLFLSKKAKLRFQERKKNTKGYAGCGYLYDEGLGIAPAVIAAAVAAASGIIAAMIPAIMNGLKKTGHQEAAQEVQNEAEGMVKQYQQAPGEVGKVAAQGADEVVEQETGEEAPEEVQPGLAGINMDSASTNLLFDTLGKVSQVAIQAAGTAVANKAKKKPKLKKFLDNAGQAADDYVTGAYLRKAGYTDTGKKFVRAANSAKSLLPYLAVGLLFVMKK